MWEGVEEHVGMWEGAEWRGDVGGCGSVGVWEGGRSVWESIEWGVKVGGSA